MIIALHTSLEPNTTVLWLRTHIDGRSGSIGTKFKEFLILFVLLIETILWKPWGRCTFFPSVSFS